MKIVAEIGINHNGDINKAKRLINIAKECGADAVKFQKRTIDLVYSEDELSKYRESPWGTTVRSQKEGLEFGQDEYEQIDSYCRLIGLPWYASPWDILSVNFLLQFDIPYIKIASALINNWDLLDKIKETSVPVIVSTGMTLKYDFDVCLEELGKQIEWILACTSSYPTPSGEMNLNFIKTLIDEYPHYKIGFSNHYPGIVYLYIAYALGAKMIEVHICESRADYGSDQAASLEPQALRKLCKDLKDIDLAMGSGQWTIFPGEFSVASKLGRVYGNRA